MNEDQNKPKGLYYLSLLLLTGRLITQTGPAFSLVAHEIVDENEKKAQVRQVSPKIQQKNDGSLFVGNTETEESDENNFESSNFPNSPNANEGELVAQNNPKPTNPNFDPNTDLDSERRFVDDDFGTEIDEVEDIETGDY